MKNSTGIIIAAVVVVGAAAAFYFIDIDQTQNAALPDVDVSVEGGQLPKFSVKTGDIDVGTKEVEVMVPKVIMVEKTVEVPTVDIEPAKE